jgi:dihydrolipoamide dehydrogenase
MAIIDIKVPDIGDFAEVAIIEVLVKPGDTIKAEQSLITVESDKASMEIPSSHAGVVKELKVKLGDKVAEGSVVLTLEVQGAGAAAPAPAAARAHRTHADRHARRVLRRGAVINAGRFSDSRATRRFWPLC